MLQHARNNALDNTVKHLTAVTKSLPILLYHYISKAQGSIAVSPDSFAAHCKSMAKAGYRGISLEEAAAFLLNGEKLAPKSVLITFDDGYLDNYVHALPILHEYGHKGTVFAVIDRLEKKGLHLTREDERAGRGAIPQGVDDPYVTDALGHKQRRDLFMSWEEARVAKAAGVLDIASHSLSHAPVWAEPPLNEWRNHPELCVLHHPAPRHRTFDRPNQPLPFGLPVLPESYGLTTRAFIPSRKLVSMARNEVPQDLEGAAAFFAAPAKVLKLREAFLALPAESWGRVEEHDEYTNRVREDLFASYTILDQQLANNTRCPLSRTCMAWPWGKYNEESLALAKEVGFQVFFCTSFGPNLPAQNPEHVHRFKARDKSPAWLLSRLALYSNPYLAKLYAAVRI